jgi:hypothetical protein
MAGPGKSREEVSQEMQGFLSLTYLMADYIGENHRDSFARWLRDNDPSAKQLSDAEIIDALHAQMVISARLNNISHSPYFGHL